MEKLNKKTASIIKLTEILKRHIQTTEQKNIILPFVLIKRLDSLLEFSKNDIIYCYNQNKNSSKLDEKLKHNSIDEKGNELGFYNYSKLNLNSIIENKDNLKENLIEYISCFSDNIQDIFKYFDIKDNITNLSEYNLLNTFLESLLSEDIDLSPKTISNEEMGEIYGELIHHFSKMDGKKSGEYTTPKDVSKLMVSVLVTDENKGNSIKIYDPACGSGKLLTCCEKILKKQNKNYNINLYGQDINPLAYAIAKSNLLIRGESFENIRGPMSTLSDDQYPNEKFDYIISNPPFGTQWRNDEDTIKKEAEKGFEGRFGAGLPRKTDSQLLFIQHMISKMNEDSKSRVAIITNEPPLSFGDIGSGESNIRKWIFENDYLETVIALPGNLFYSTSIPIYLLIFTNKKIEKRKGKVQLINARENTSQTNEMPRKHELGDETIQDILNNYNSFEDSKNSKILDNDDFGFKKIIIERPMQRNYQITPERLENLHSIYRFEKLAKNQRKTLDTKLKEEERGKQKQEKIKQLLLSIGDEIYENRLIFQDKIIKTLSPLKLDSKFIKDIVNALSEHDDTVEIELDKRGKPKADPQLRESKKIPLKENIEDYFNSHIKNIYPNAWIKQDEIQTGYEINFIHLNYDEKLFFDDIDYPISFLDNLVKLKQTNKISYEYDLFLKRIGNVKPEKVIYFPHELPQKTRKNLPTYIGCKIKDKNLLKEYLYYYLNSNKGIEHFLYFQRTIHTNINDLSRLPIPLPDIETQKKIVETSRLMEQFFKEMEIWKTNYQNNILNYESSLESYKDFSCSIQFGEDGGVSDFCHNWRIVYQGLIWPLAYAYLKATKGSKYDSTIKHNHLVLFEFLAAFNVIILISAIKDSDIPAKQWKNIKKYLWQLFKNNKKTWHNMHFGGWTTLYWRLSNIYKDEQYGFNTKINKDFFDKLSQKRYQDLFNNLRDKERNPDAHSGLEDDIDTEAKLDDLKIYMDTDIFEILNLYSGLKLYYITEDIKRISPKKILHTVMSLNGPCDPPNWHEITTYNELEPHCLYLYDSLNNSYLKIDNDLIKFGRIEQSKQYGIYIYDGVDLKKNVARYKCYHHKNEIMEVTLNTKKDTYFKVSEEFLKDVLRI